MIRDCVLRLVALSLAVTGSASAEEAVSGNAKPNFLVILADDLGYGDLACYGAKDIATPNLDRMAAEGVKFTSFYVAPVCSPSRAALMTGCHGKRVGIGGVLFPRNDHGLNSDEATLPELLKKQGYATAIVGKWHLGNEDVFQPMNHGFDTWYGTPASNSQFYDPTLKEYATNCIFREGHTRESILERDQADCPLVRDNVVIEVPADQSLFTQRYTAETIRLLSDYKERDVPFFLYLAHNMPHIPLHASETFAGKSERGLYGDVIEELDWSTGQIIEALEELGLDENTLVIFTSDNGPKLSAGGSAGPLRGEKGDTFDGGVRVPCIARWPGKIPSGFVTDEPATVMDLLPTFVKLAGSAPPKDRVIDGKDIRPLLSGTDGAKSPHEAIYYIRGNHVDGIRVGDWKYQDASRNDETKKAEKTAKKRNKKKGGEDDAEGVSETPPAAEAPTASLFNLREDIGEKKNLIGEHPEIADKLKKMRATFASELQKNQRPAGVAIREEKDQP